MTNLGSIAGFVPGPNMALYYASKSFVLSFSEALHQELRRTGVTVTCAAPGPVSTEFLQKSGANRVALFKILPKFDSEYVAQCTWRGFKSGRRLVVPGISAKLAAIFATWLPLAIKLPLIWKLQHRSNDTCLCGSGTVLGTAAVPAGDACGFANHPWKPLNGFQSRRRRTCRHRRGHRVRHPVFPAQFGSTGT